MFEPTAFAVLYTCFPVSQTCVRGSVLSCQLLTDFSQHGPISEVKNSVFLIILDYLTLDP